ncbi:MAG TPA: hypothetical protein VGC42_06615 [Kofleriaceae bacterium]
MNTLSISILSSVTGGFSTQAANVCNRSQFDWMAAHIVPDNAVKPGVQRHVVVNDAKTCGFPMPK